MKFTLNVKIETAIEFAKFVDDLDLVIDLPFLNNKKQIQNECDIEHLTNVNEEQKKYIVTLMDEVQMYRKIKASPNNVIAESPDPEASVVELTVANKPEAIVEEIAVAKIQEAIPTPLKKVATGTHATHVMKPKPCATCGESFVPYHNRVQCCDTCRSKKVKSPQTASD